jgi:hypothetical protein
MDVVVKFLEARRRGDHDTAIGMMQKNALLGSPWGYRYGDSEYVEFLKDEVKFRFRGYLDDVPIQEVAPNTFQRKFEYDKGFHQQQHMRSHYWTNSWLSWFPIMRANMYFRECYFVEDGKIKLVTCFKQQ